MAYDITGDPVTAGNLPYRTDVASGISGAPHTVNATNELWLPIWSGEVIHAYDEHNKFESMVTSKTIASGNEMVFPITGTVDLKPAWNAGEELIGGADQTSTTFKVQLDKANDVLDKNKEKIRKMKDNLRVVKRNVVKLKRKITLV